MPFLQTAFRQSGCPLPRVIPRQLSPFIQEIFRINSERSNAPNFVVVNRISQNTNSHPATQHSFFTFSDGEPTPQGRSVFHGAASIKRASGVAVYPPSLAEPSRSPNCFNADARTSPCGPLLLSTLTRAVSIGWGPLSVFFTDGLGGVFYKSIPLPGSPSDITGSPDHKWLAVILRGRHRCVRRGFLHRRRVLSALLRLAA
jgi:hypothetical protein